MHTDFEDIIYNVNIQEVLFLVDALPETPKCLHLFSSKSFFRRFNRSLREVVGRDGRKQWKTQKSNRRNSLQVLSFLTAFIRILGCPQINECFVFVIF